MNKENKSVEMANLRIYFSDYFGVEERAILRSEILSSMKENREKYYPLM